MRIKYTESLRNQSQECHLSEYVSASLDGGLYGTSGTIEDIKESNERIREAFGRMINTLADKGIINLVEVKAIIKSYDEVEKA